MSTDFDGVLRTILMKQAADAPDASSLLAGVHARRRRQTMHRGAALLSVAAVTAAVVLGAGQTGLLRQGEDHGTSTGARSVNELVPVPSNWLPAFPLTPGWLPPRLGPARTAYTSHEQVTSVRYVDERDRARPPEAVRSVIIATSHVRLFPVQRGTRRSISINGRPVTAYAGPIAQGTDGRPLGMGVEVAWERRPGQWVNLICESTLGTFDNVRRIAESLRDVPIRPTSYFRLAGLPEGLTSLGGYGPSELLLLPAGERDQNKVPEERLLSVQLQKSIDRQGVPRPGVVPPGQDSLVISGRPAWYSSNARLQMLNISLKGDTILLLRAPATVPRSLLMKFIAGLTVLPSAQAVDVG